MTNKTKTILRTMKRWNGKKSWTLFRSPETRDRVLGEFNALTLDPVGPIDQGVAILKEMNELEVGQDEFVKSLAPRPSVL